MVWTKLFEEGYIVVGMLEISRQAGADSGSIAELTLRKTKLVFPMYARYARRAHSENTDLICKNNFAQHNNHYCWCLGEKLISYKLASRY
jgi:hypothetical protein